MTTSGRDRRRVVVLVERRYLRQRQPAGLCAALGELGLDVEVLDPEQNAYRAGDDRWLEGVGAIVPRGRSHPLLHLLGWAEWAGVPVLHRRSVVEGVRDKAAMALALERGGVPTPATYFGRPSRLAEVLSPADFPLLLKPVFGDNSTGLTLVARPSDLAALSWPDPLALAQRWVDGGHVDLKLYGAGDDVWAVRRRSPLAPVGGGGEAAELVPVTPALAEIARRCRALFGLELYGVDCLETQDGPLVVEVNEFPNYVGVPEVDGALARLVGRLVEER